MSFFKSLRLLSAISFMLIIHSGTMGQTYMPDAVFYPDSVNSENNRFGKAIDVDSATAVIGAPFCPAGQLYSGIVYVYQLTDGIWNKIASLTPSAPQEFLHFGTAVAISGTVILVSATENNEKGQGAGMVYVFLKPPGGWVDGNENYRVFPDELSEFNYFGTSMDICGDVAVISATGSAENRSLGSVYVYQQLADWASMERLAKLRPSDPVFQNYTSDNFGRSVCITDSTIYVGSPYQEGPGNDNGAIYVFEAPPTGWKDTTETAILVQSDPNVTDFFGYSVSASGDYVIGGSPQTNGITDYAGAAYIFKKPEGGWTDATEIAKLIPSDGFKGQKFGSSVAVTDKYIYVGINNKKARPGIYVFRKPAGEWEDSYESAIIYPADTSRFYGSEFGSTIYVNDEYILAGAPADNIYNESSGSVFYFENPGDWTSQPETQSLTSLYPSASNIRFGSGIDYYDNYMIAGAIDDNGGIGAAYIFERIDGNWMKTAKLSVSFSKSSMMAGIDVAINKEWVAVGASHYSDSLSNRGCVLLYKKPVTGWKDTTETRVIYSPEPYAREYFGNNVDMDDQTLVIGGFDGGSSESVGKIYILTQTGGDWPEEGMVRLEPSGSALRQFGIDLELHKDNLIVGTGLSRRAYIFSKGPEGWNPEQTAVFSCDGFINNFGYRVSLTDYYAAVASPSEYHRPGSVYVFEKEGGNWVSMDVSSAVRVLNPAGIVLRFGTEVDINKNRLSIGYIDQNHPEIPDSVFMLYNPSYLSWDSLEMERLAAPIHNEGMNYSDHIEVGPGKMVISAPYADTEKGYRSGSVFIYANQEVPVIENVYASNSDGLYRIGDTIEIRMIFNGIVQVEGQPWLELHLSGQTGRADYQKGSGTDTLTFRYIIQKNDFSGRLSYSHTNALNLFGSHIFLSGSTGWDKSLPEPGDPGSLKYNNDITVDGILPDAFLELTFRDTTNLDTCSIRIIASEKLKLFDPSDFTLENATFSDIVYIDSSLYQLKILPGHTGIVNVNIPGEKIMDLAGNHGEPVSVSFYFDNTAPAATFNCDKGVELDTIAAKLYISFDEPVFGYSIDDLTAVNAELHNFTSLSDTHYQCDLFPVNPGEIRVTLKSKSVSDKAGNFNIESAFLLHFAEEPYLYKPGYKLLASDRKSYMEFGKSVSVSGGFMIVGSPGASNEQSGNHTGGAAYVYKRIPSGWIQYQKFSAPDYSTDNFGSSVSISGNFAAVSSFEDGRVFILRKTGLFWYPDSTILGTSSGFGADVKLSGGLLVIGDPDAGSGNSGSAYVYEISSPDSSGSWVQTAKIEPSVHVPSGHFGSRIAVDNNIIVVGISDPSDQEDGINAVFVFEKSGGQWSETTILHSDFPDSDHSRKFGSSIAVSGTTIAVGASQDTLGHSGHGAVYIFRKSGMEWAGSGRILVNDPEVNSAGTQIALSGSILMAKATYEDFSSVLAYQLDNLSVTDTLFLFDDSHYTQGYTSGMDFGGSLDISGKVAVIGNFTSEENSGQRTGSAYVYDFLFNGLTKPSDLKIDTVSLTSVGISWTDNASDENGYWIEWKSGNMEQNNLFYYPLKDANSFYNFSSPYGSTYFYTVRAFAFNAGGPVSEILRIEQYIAAPSGLAAADSIPDQIHLHWNDNSDNEEGFIIERSELNNFTDADTIILPSGMKEYIDRDLDSRAKRFYRVKAFNRFLESTPSNIVGVQPLLTGLKGQEKENIFIYPNPNDGRFYIRSRDNAGKADIVIYNLAGEKIREIRSVDFSGYRIDLSNCKRGVYILLLKNEKLGLTRKIVIY